MKSIEFDIDEIVFSDFFSPIRDKIGIIKCLLATIKYISYYNFIDVSEVKGKLTLDVSKMNRINYSCDDKYFSITCPFSIEIFEGEVKFSSYANGEIDQQMVSQLLYVLEDSDTFNAACISGLADKIMDESERKPLFWNVLKELLMMEDGYIRYDYDPDPERVHPTIHPINHLDVCYSSNATFKVGLNNRISHVEFRDILDITSNCYFLANS
ncbi:TPA: hypothetical protein JG809_004620 [Vibrio parahaemolyticus]|uniref:hypothetical protein n=1 Tax=Vibrio parahaemolyticus TaxID=670 RepID=UPI00227C004C|nr:hypothetical protein [Vibrio parahaemolyticus]WAG32048.1 hypothetical protein JK088_09920 [Vibrio parahaemolyticus]HAV1432155.1 hypothetical protein [Vibrio parahaemolyticus]HDM8235631.1 hypothetical protein [Vibrio campbellii]